MYSLAKQIVMTDTSLRSFSVFVSAAVKRFARPGGINRLPKEIGLYIMTECLYSGTRSTTMSSLVLSARIMFFVRNI